VGEVKCPVDVPSAVAAPRPILKRLEALGTGSLAWVEAKPLVSELRAGGDVVATLAWAKRWSSLATAEAADGRWTLKRTGFLRPQITVRASDSDVNFAIVSMGSGGDGVLDFANGRSYQFRGSGVRHPGLTVSDARGRTILTLTLDPRGEPTSASVEVVREAFGSDQPLALLAILGWYLPLLMSRYDYESGDLTGALVATWS